MYSRKVIFIVDDDRATVEVVSTLLREKGYFVMCCHNQGGLWDHLHNIKPDLIILDYWIGSGQNGISLATEVRTIENGRFIHIPILFSSGIDQDGEAAQAIHAMPNTAVLYKPFDINEFNTMIEQLLEKKHLK